MEKRQAQRRTFEGVRVAASGLLLAVILTAGYTGNAEDNRDEAFAETAIGTTAATWANCVPTEVIAFSNRIHVRCAAAVGGGIRFFAVPTSNAPHAARVQSMLTTAQVAGRTLRILYEPGNTSGSSFGCGPQDCRQISAVGFGQ